MDTEIFDRGGPEGRSYKIVERGGPKSLKMAFKCLFQTFSYKSFANIPPKGGRRGGGGGGERGGPLPNSKSATASQSGCTKLNKICSFWYFHLFKILFHSDLNLQNLLEKRCLDTFKESLANVIFNTRNKDFLCLPLAKTSKYLD